MEGELSILSEMGEMSGRYVQVEMFGTTLPHQVLDTALRRGRPHTVAFCRSTQTVRPPHVDRDVRSTGVLLMTHTTLFAIKGSNNKKTKKTKKKNRNK